MEESKEKEDKEAEYFTEPEETKQSAAYWNKRVENAKILQDHYGLTVQELREFFKYSGGDGNKDCDDSYESVRASRHLSYWRMTRGSEPTPTHRNQCICSVKIKENCYIVDTRNRDVIVIIGNCCIKRFCSVDKAGRTCDKCEARHRNRKYNLCNECKPPVGWLKCEECNEPCKKQYTLCYSHRMIKLAKEEVEKERAMEAEKIERVERWKIEMEKRRSEIATRRTMSDTEDEIERKCACGKVLTGTYKKCYNCYKGIDPNATHPCETCEKPVKGTFKNCFLCNQKLRQEKC